MAHVLRLSDGTTTINLLNENTGVSWCHLADGGLRIRFPRKKQTWSGQNLWSMGKTLTAHAYDNRTIEIEFEIGGTTWDNIFDMRGSINLLLDSARQAQLYGNVASVYLEYQVDSTTGPVFFDVLDGDLIVPEDLMSLEKLTWKKGASSQFVLKDIRLVLQCKPYARGAEVQIITSESIENTDDGTYDNYVDWAAADVNGDVPGPLRIRIKNTYNDSARMGTYYVGLRDVGTPSSWVGVYEAEDGTGGTPAAHADYSDGNAVTFSQTTTDNDVLMYWDMAATATPIEVVGKFRAIGIGTFHTECKYSLRASYAGLTTLHQYPQKRPWTSGHIDFGVIDMLPWNIGIDQSSGSWRLHVYSQPDDVGAKATTIDALVLIPADDYKYRKLAYKGYYAQYNAYTEDIGIRDQVAHGSTSKVMIVDFSGLPIHAKPQQAGKLCFLTLGSGGGWTRSLYTSDIDVWHTPYYLDVRGAN